MAFDYETTGLRPYDSGHEIVCCGIASELGAFAFEMTANLDLRRWLKRLLMSERIPKTAHNLKFETQWTNVILGHPVRNWAFCSMLGSHLLDNRPGVSGLKFQAYVNFGVGDYSSKIEPYLSTREGEKFNRVKEAPLRDLLQYCGMDALVQYHLAMRQMEGIGIA
jgi:hypothetical protein